MNARHRSAKCAALIAPSICWLMAPAPAGFAEQDRASTVQRGAPTVVTTLTKIIGIMRLPREVAAQELPVEVEGVVTCTYSGDGAFCPMVRGIEIQSLGPSTVPAPRPVSFAVLPAGPRTANGWRNAAWCKR